MARNVLSSLFDVRQEDERQAERVLHAALAARARAEAEVARLREGGLRARTELAARRRQGVDDRGSADGAGNLDGSQGTERAAHALGQQRFLARLAGDVEVAVEAVAAFARDTLAPARVAEDAARAAHLRARQRREVVERALARRQAARRLEAERRAEAATDDLPSRPPPARRDRGGGKDR